MRTTKTAQVLPLRSGKKYGPDHHIWDNNGTWWAHFSITRQRGPSKRVRVSLHTSNRKEAQERRDQLMKTAPDKIADLTARWQKLRKG